MDFSEFQKQVTQALPGEWDVYHVPEEFQSDSQASMIATSDSGSMIIRYWTERDSWEIAMTTILLNPSSQVGVQVSPVALSYCGIGHTLEAALRNLSLECCSDKSRKLS